MFFSLNARRWCILFTAVSITFIGIVFGVNYTVDPFGSRSWIVEKKYKPIVHERSEKYNYIFHQNNIEKYDCVILGSSRIMTIMPENNDDTKGCYNFGIHVANNPEKLFILEEWLKKAPLKKVYLGNELYNVHARNNPLAISHPKFTRGSESNYLSLTTLNISIKSLLYALQNRPQTYFETDGTIRYSAEEEAIKNKIFDHSAEHFHELAANTLQNDYLRTPFTYEKQALYPLQQIKKLCDEHRIELYPFITPTYGEMQNQLQAEPFLKDASSKFRQDLTQIFGKVYDFDINHTLNNTPENFYDALHYRPQIAERIVSEMENHSAMTYGVIRLRDDFWAKGK